MCEDKLTDLQEDLKCPFCGSSDWSMLGDVIGDDGEVMSEADLDEYDEEEIMESKEIRICGVEVVEDLLVECKCFSCGKLFNVRLCEKEKRVKIERNIN